MEFNGTKFECLKYGTNRMLKESYSYINSDSTEAIEDKENIRDLGIILSDNGDYSEHINRIVRKAKQKCGWIARSFHRNTVDFRKMMWKTYVQSVLDYGSQIWSPTNQSQITHLESVQRMYTVTTEGLGSLNYWERLLLMKISSVQRRHERYKVFYIGKVLQGLVPNFGISWNSNQKREW